MKYFSHLSIDYSITHLIKDKGNLIRNYGNNDNDEDVNITAIMIRMMTIVAKE